MSADLKRAFANADRETWTESQRRVAMYIEFLEKRNQQLEDSLERYQRAAAEAWLEERLRR